MIPGGSSIAGTSLPISKGVELYDWANGQRVMQKGNEWMNSTTRGTAAFQNNNTQIVADKRIEAPKPYQTDLNQALAGPGLGNNRCDQHRKRYRRAEQPGRSCYTTFWYKLLSGDQA